MPDLLAPSWFVPTDQPACATAVEVPAGQTRDSVPLALRAEYIESITAIDHPLTAAITARLGQGPVPDSQKRGPAYDPGQGGERAIPAADVLAAAVSAAIRIAVERWTEPADGQPRGLLVVPRGRLDSLLRSALAHVAPALRAAELEANDSPAV